MITFKNLKISRWKKKKSKLGPLLRNLGISGRPGSTLPQGRRFQNCPPSVRISSVGALQSPRTLLPSHHRWSLLACAEPAFPALEQAPRSTEGKLRPERGAGGGGCPSCNRQCLVSASPDLRALRRVQEPSGNGQGPLRSIAREADSGGWHPPQGARLFPQRHATLLAVSLIKQQSG